MFDNGTILARNLTSHRIRTLQQVAPLGSASRKTLKDLSGLTVRPGPRPGQSVFLFVAI